MLLELRKIEKKFLIDKDNYFYALKNINISFPKSGLFSIVGKSGSGKSTLLNIISLIEKPNGGEIIFKKKFITSLSEKRKENFIHQNIGIIFQEYHLFEDETVLYNLCLPLLFKGVKFLKAKESAIKLASEFGLGEELLSRKVSSLSGGEKQRAAIIRAIIKKPKILICDEPTGALDSSNSVLVMEMLKEISKDTLVIVVTHNLLLAEKYSLSMVEIKDGKIIRNLSYLPEKNIEEKNKDKIRRSNKWTAHFIDKNIKKHIKHNLLSIVSFSFGVIAFLLVLGFSLGNEDSVKEYSYRQFDYGSATISKQEIKDDTSLVSIVHSSKPTDKDLKIIGSKIDNYFLTVNADYLLANSKIMIGEKEIKDISLSPIFSFLDSSIDRSLLLKGDMPINDSLKTVVVNQSAYDLIKQTSSIDPFSLTYSLTQTCSVSTYIEENDENVTDYFTYSSSFFISGIVDDINFLNTPKIYYSYNGFLEYLSAIPLLNLSSKIGEEISWLERIENANESESVSSYSYRLFLKNSSNKNLIAITRDDIDDPYCFSSSCLEKSIALLGLFEASNIGMDVFLLIIIIGAVFIVGLISLSSYSSERKNIAILSSFGVKKEDIISVFVYENLFYIIISLFLSFVLVFPLAKLTNLLIEKFVGCKNVVNLNFHTSFFNIDYFIPLSLIICSIILSIFVTIIPILFSKKISIKEELQSL